MVYPGNWCGTSKKKKIMMLLAGLLYSNIIVQTVAGAQVGSREDSEKRL